MRKISLLGATGSIGTQTLDVVRGLGRCGAFPVQIEVLAAHSNIRLLEEQVREFHPKAVAVYDQGAAKELKLALRDLPVTVLAGMEGLCEAAAWPSADFILNSVVGMVGLQPTLAALEAKKTLALANKETLVAGGALVMEAAARNGCAILPVDSEHSAIFQCLQGAPPRENQGHKAKKLILTASGGPFFGKTKEELARITCAQAMRHPNWSMGPKVTIDSATLMNKGLEVIEAAWLFSMTSEEIQVVIHRESVVHSLVEYADHSVIAQLGVPDMAIPIQYAITYPHRVASQVEPLKLWEYQNLSFFQPDLKTFRCLAVCQKALERGGMACTAANAANERAVQLFLEGKISFLEIAQLVEAAADREVSTEPCTLEGIFQADARARDYVDSLL